MLRERLVPLLLAANVAACGSDSSGPTVPARTYRMGFSAIPPRPDTALVLPTLALATQHSDAGLIQLSIPWTVLLGGGYVGIERDRTDFPFTDALGLSSYPYLGGYTQPEDVPVDYYSRLVAENPLPELVLEGGWPSVAAGAVSSSPEMQDRYIRRHAQILDAARASAVFQITFTDLDLSASPPPPGSVLPLFAHLGLVDSVLAPKAALAVWDSLRALDLAP